MKKIGVFLTATPEDGGMFQYSLAMVSALGALPSEQYSLVAAYEDPAWSQHIPHKAVRMPFRRPKMGTFLAALPAILPVSCQRWGRALSRFSGWADGLLGHGCKLWVFPRQDVWSALFPGPALASVHDLMHRYEPHFPENSRYGRARYRDGYLRIVCQKAEGILVDSELGKQQVADCYGTPAGKLFVLPYIPAACLSEAVPPVEFEAKYQLPAKYIFYPAQFWEHKNHVRLIHAMSEVCRALPDVCLVLVGSRKNGFAAALRAVRKLGLEGHIRFAGYVPQGDMAEFYRRARALVFPTLFGPTNIPPLEAFVLGCPVAVSGIYGMPEQIGEAGLLFDPRSVHSIADSIMQLWVDDALCQKLRIRGKAKAAAWGRDQFGAALEAIIRQLTSASACEKDAENQPKISRHMA